MNILKRFFTLERIAAIAVLAIVCWQLFLPPPLGLADNGDFERMMVFFDLRHMPKEWGDQYFGYFDRWYVFDRGEAAPHATPGFISSETTFIAAAAALHWYLGRPWFDLLVLGALHVAVFVGGVYFLLQASKAFSGPVRTTGIILGALVFTDISYIAYFNSFYSETASFLFFLLAAGCAYGAITASHQRIAWTAAYFVAVTGFLLAKYQNLPLLPVFLFFGWLLLVRQGGMKYLYAYLMIAFFVCYGGYRFYLSAPAEDVVLYDSVFNGVLVDSPTPQDDLVAFGLDPELAGYAGTTAFTPGSASLFDNPEFMQQFHQSVTTGSVIRFYLRRPARLIAALDRTLGFALQTNAEMLGNYEKRAGYPPGKQSRSWAMWSSFRSLVLPESLVFFLIVCIVYIGLLAWKWLQEENEAGRLNLEWLALILPMALAQLLLITFFEGVHGMVKHAFLFNIFFDVMLVAIVAQLLTRGVKPRTAGEPAEGGLS